MKFNLAIIDSDPIVYRAGFSIEKRNKDTETFEVEPLSHALYNVNSMMKYCLDNSNTSNYKAFLTSSDQSNFRFKIFPAYKANRIGTRKPYWYKEIREYLQNRWKAEIIFNEEADDACSICHCSANDLGFSPDILNSIVWTIDKDFNNFPGWHGNYITKEIYYVSELEALQNFYLQILTGDTSDGIPRIKKGWKQKNSEKEIRQAQTERDLRLIVEQTIKDIYPEYTKEKREKTIRERGQLVWLRRCPNEMWGTYE
jgi:5'-3' exonuclease